MKLNRKWLLAIALVLSLTMAIGGTLAYLTDRDTVENTFTMGNVDIKVEEEFEHNSPLYPGVEVDKKAGITNTHATEPAYVWMTVSVPSDLAQYIELGWDGASPEDCEYTIHEGYVSYVVKHNDILNPGASTPKYLQTVTLSEKVDFQEGSYVVVEGGEIKHTFNDLSDVKIIVDGFAIQTEGFDDVDEAYAAYTIQWNGLNGGDSGVTGGEDEEPATPVANAAELKAAVAAGGKVMLTADVNMGAETLTINGVDLNLNGNTLSSTARNGVLYMKDGSSVKNGTIQHNGTVAAIKVWKAEAIEDVTINLAGKSTSNNVITGISVQEGSDTYLKSIKNVTVNSTGENLTYNGIETYNCGGRDANDYAIGSMENVKVNVNGTALLLSAPAGKATKCTFDGDVWGIDMHLKGAYNVALELVDCDVNSVHVYDEAALTNPGTLTLVYDAETNITNGVNTESVVEKNQVTINGNHPQ